jgi:tetratricopeptide (TPR) repeat protein
VVESRAVSLRRVSRLAVAFRAARLVAATLLYAGLPGCLRAGEARLREGNQAAREGRLDDARKAFQAAVEALPGDPRPRELLGNVLYELGRPGDARAAWQEALSLDGQSHHAHLGLARLALDAQDAGAALEALGTLRSAAVDSSLAAEEAAVRGLALLQRGQPGDAEGALLAVDEALSHVPGHAVALYVRGGALLVLGRYSEAQASLDELSMKHPASPLGPYGLARLAAAQGRATDVLLHLTAAKAAAGAAWRPERVAADPAFAFLSTSEGFLALVAR